MDVEVGSGNVFADLGFPDAAELDIKVRLTVEIVKLINARRLSQVAAAELLKINQPKAWIVKEAFQCQVVAIRFYKALKPRERPAIYPTRHIFQ